MNFERKYEWLEFENEEDFWQWFWNAYAGKEGSAIFGDFCLVGCWNWVLRWSENEYFSELLSRYHAARELHISPWSVFDHAPARHLEGLITLSSEIKSAQVEYGKRKNT